MSELVDVVRERYAAKALQMARPGVTGSLDLSCGLTDAERAGRRVEWRAIDDSALIDRSESGGTVTSTYLSSPATRAELTRLVQAERVCCGTASWTLRDDEGDRLHVTVQAESASCCDDGCCGATYSSDELASVGVSPGASLGCGNPTLLADLRAGETVLDLGSGAGLDVLLSARRVGPSGHAYGVDMTDEMLAVAKDNQAKSGIANATFLKGTIEAIPLPAASVDVVISNCVINLAADKRAVLREAHRVLRPGGRLAVADMVALAELPADVKRSLDRWAGCVAGTISVDEYTAALGDAGFTAVAVEVTHKVHLDGVAGAIASAYIRASA